MEAVDNEAAAAANTAYHKNNIPSSPARSDESQPMTNNITSSPPIHQGLLPSLYNLQELSSEEYRKNEDMEIFLSNHCDDVYDTEDGHAKRLMVIEKLNSIAKEWIIEIGTDRNIPEEYLMDSGVVQLRLFGSTRLGVHNIESDIDILFLAPMYITRLDFFQGFTEKLHEKEEVDSILSIPQAYTPVLKFTIHGQAVDMVFASLQLMQIPPNIDIVDMQYLAGLDDQSVRSLNGSRVAEWIIRLVPDIKTFCATLRAVKYWARQRGLYSNVLGFLGGINCAIMVALVCQIYVNSCPYTLVRRFFELYSAWRWPSPVMLREIEDVRLKDSSGRFLPVWNPKANYKDSLHLMPIITPAYPAMNSAYNISPPHFRAIHDELVRACTLFQQNDRNNTFPWSRLFEPCTAEFFRKYPRYIQINICAQTDDDHRNWFGWVESRLRLLILSLEQPPVVYCHPIANCFHRTPADLQNGQSVFDAVTGVAGVLSPSSSRQQLVETDKSIAKLQSIEKDESKGHSSNVLNNQLEENQDVKQRHSYPGMTNSPTIAEINNENPVFHNNGKTDLHEGVEQQNYGTAISGGIGRRTSFDDTAALPAPITSPLGNNSALRLDRPQSSDRVPLTVATPGLAPCTSYVSAFFIGLSFQYGTRYADVSPAVNDFSLKVNSWAGKKASMKLLITACNCRDLPHFVFEAKAEPSNVKSCTPKVERNTFQNDEANDAERMSGNTLETPERSGYNSNLNPPTAINYANSMETSGFSTVGYPMLSSSSQIRDDNHIGRPIPAALMSNAQIKSADDSDTLAARVINYDRPANYIVNDGSPYRSEFKKVDNSSILSNQFHYLNTVNTGSDAHGNKNESGNEVYSYQQIPVIPVQNSHRLPHQYQLSRGNQSQIKYNHQRRQYYQQNIGIKEPVNMEVDQNLDGPIPLHHVKSWTAGSRLKHFNTDAPSNVIRSYEQADADRRAASYPDALNSVGSTGSTPHHNFKGKSNTNYRNGGGHKNRQHHNNSSRIRSNSKGSTTSLESNSTHGGAFQQHGSHHRYYSHNHHGHGHHNHTHQKNERNDNRNDQQSLQRNKTERGKNSNDLKSKSLDDAEMLAVLVKSDAEPKIRSNSEHGTKLSVEVDNNVVEEQVKIVKSANSKLAPLRYRDALVAAPPQTPKESDTSIKTNSTS